MKLPKLDQSKQPQLGPQLNKKNPTANEFDLYYNKEDPWQTRSNPEELAKIEKINCEFKYCSFNNGLDLGCGEGHLTASLKFVNSFDGVDISEVALNRAKKNYPHINFRQLDIRDLSSIENNKYDFISCFETLYYVSEQSERERIVNDIKFKGKDNCIFCFSVVTIGENQHRRYFTYEEAITFFGKHFNIINHFPISMGGYRQSYLTRFHQKIKKKLSKPEDNFNIYLSKLNTSNPKEAYQCMFVLTKS